MISCGVVDAYTFPFLVAITIGLDDVRVPVDEDVGTAEICASVTVGDLQRAVVISVTLEDRGAIGECSPCITLV